MSVSTKVTDNIPAAIKGNEAGNEAGILETCIVIEGYAKAFAPVDMGLLRGSITYKTTLREGSPESPAGAENQLTITPKKGEGYVGTNVNYGIYQEFGTRFMKASPFLRPAGLAANNPGQIKEIIKFFNSEMGRSVPKAK